MSTAAATKTTTTLYADRTLTGFMSFIGAKAPRTMYVGEVIHMAYIYALEPTADGAARHQAFDACSAAHKVSTDALMRWAEYGW